MDDFKIENVKKMEIMDIYSLVENGELNPLKAMLVLKEIEKKAKDYKTKIEEMAIDEITKHERSETQIGDYNLKMKRAAGRWDFKHIDEINDLEKQIKAVKEKHKNAYNQMLQNVTAIGEGGEVIIPANFKHGKEIIVISKKK
jgi:hypothetical protein